MNASSDQWSRPFSSYFQGHHYSSLTQLIQDFDCQYWQHMGQPKRTQFVHLDQAYHGDTLGAVSVGGISLFHQTFLPLTFPSISAPVPYHSQEGNLGVCLDSMEQIFDEHRGLLAGIIVEPLVQGAGGMKMVRPNFLQKVEKKIRQANSLLITDGIHREVNINNDVDKQKLDGLIKSKNIFPDFYMRKLT